MFRPVFFSFTAAALVLSACAETSSAVGSSAGSQAEANCLSAVAATTGQGDVSTISVSPSEAGTSVLVQVAGAQAPWKCVANPDGSVAEVEYTAEG